MQTFLADLQLAFRLPLPKVFGALFYDRHLGEPRIYIILPMCIFAVALLAPTCRRATRVDPMTALRQE